MARYFPGLLQGGCGRVFHALQDQDFYENMLVLTGKSR